MRARALLVVGLGVARVPTHVFVVVTVLNGRGATASPGAQAPAPHGRPAPSPAGPPCQTSGDPERCRRLRPIPASGAASAGCTGAAELFLLEPVSWDELDPASPPVSHGLPEPLFRQVRVVAHDDLKRRR